jgi:hypothetical protein
VLVRTLAGYGVVAEGGEGERIGVWTATGRKIASLGIHLSRWRTTHGFALNVAPDLRLFGGIVACGMPAGRDDLDGARAGARRRCRRSPAVSPRNSASVFGREPRRTGARATGARAG